MGVTSTTTGRKRPHGDNLTSNGDLTGQCDDDVTDLTAPQVEDGTGDGSANEDRRALAGDSGRRQLKKRRMVQQRITWATAATGAGSARRATAGGDSQPRPKKRRMVQRKITEASTAAQAQPGGKGERGQGRNGAGDYPDCSTRADRDYASDGREQDPG